VSEVWTNVTISRRHGQTREGMSEGSRTEAHGESRGIATGPWRPSSAARLAATQGVTGQKSAEAVVAGRGRSSRR